MMTNTKQTAVLVTGSSSGIGLTITKKLAQENFCVYACARKAQDLAMLDKINNVQAIKLDVTSQTDIDAAVTFIDQQGHGLYGIVNNAGITTFANMNDSTEKDIQCIFDVNVFGPYRINKAFSSMLVTSGGRTITIGSISGYIAHAGNGAYAMSKFAMEGYTDSYAQEMEEHGVHVSIVVPGGYKSNLLHNVDRTRLSKNINRRFDAALARNEQLTEPHEVAEAVLHVMSSKNPKRRYLVAPKKQAEHTISTVLNRAEELNDYHR